MILSDTASIAKNIRDGNISSIYYFYGKDTSALENFVKKLTAKLCPADSQMLNLHKFSGKNLDISAISDSCQAIPMFAERVLILIDDLNIDEISKEDITDLTEILKKLDKFTTVVIYSTGVDLYKGKKYVTPKNKKFIEDCSKIGGVVCEFSYKKPSELAKSIIASFNKYGCSISKKDAEFLANLCLCNTAFIKSEIEKLCSYKNWGKDSNTVITRNDINSLCVRHIESDGYSLAINLLKGNAPFIFTRVDELFNQNYDPFEILNIISFSMTDIYRVRLARSSGLTYQDVARDFKYPKNREFSIRNAYSECGNISVAKMRKIIDILSKTDYKLKTNSGGKDADKLTLQQGLASSLAIG